MPLKIHVINGPNLNMLGNREKNIYGNKSLEDINNNLIKTFTSIIELEFFQNNSEGEIINYIHTLSEKKTDGIVINAGAYTHTSIAIRDSLLSINIPFIEVHLSNIYKREEFRQKSYLSDIAIGIISGFGEDSYKMAIQYFINHPLK